MDDKKIAGTIFSKDRALQLDALLRSFHLCCSDRNLMDLKIIYKASDAYHKELYNKLIPMHDSVEFIEEKDFKSDLLLQANKYQYIFFMVDDNIFIRNFSLSEIMELLNAEQDALGFSLRLGENIKYHYPSSAMQALPLFVEIKKNILKYDWTQANLYFAYPLEVSSSVYRMEDLTDLLIHSNYQNPNTLEAELAGQRNRFAQTRKNLLCYRHSAAFCNPANKVQNIFPQNRVWKREEYSSDNLARLFEEGHIIDVFRYSTFTPISCHQEVEYEFLDSDSTSGLLPKSTIVHDLGSHD